MAKEHGLEEHKGKTIPKEVKSLADRIRKKQPDKSDEYAYRTAWDIYRSYTAEGKRYPHKSSESGLKREGGGTGPLSKTSSVNEDIWEELIKQAGIVAKAKTLAKPGFLGKVKPTVPPTGGTLNYAEMRAAELAKARAKPQATLSYAKGQAPVYTAPGKSIEESKALAQAKLKEQSEKRIQHAMAGGYTDPQIRRNI